MSNSISIISCQQCNRENTLLYDKERNLCGYKCEDCNFERWIKAEGNWQEKMGKIESYRIAYAI